VSGWSECMRSLDAYLPGIRFQWPPDGDFNCSSGVTISDYWGALGWLWHYPGDLLLYKISANSTLGPFFEIASAPPYGNWFSAAVPFALFWCALLAFGALAEKLCP
jgi:hypothetical protein